MESIKFYKLVSPYPEDVTMNCKLTITDMDDNFLAFKDNDISAATFNAEELMINVIRNNGEEINIDISDIKDNIHEQITSEISGITEIISGTTLNPQPYTYYVGTSDLDDIDSETITSNFEKKEGKASMVYHNLHVHNGEYIWVVLPDNMEIIEIMSDGMTITLDYEIEDIIINGESFHAYRNLQKLIDSDWHLKIYTEGSDYDKYGFNIGITDIKLNGDLNEDGTLTLSWETSSGTSQTSITGFVVDNTVYHNDSLHGNGSKLNPLRICPFEKNHIFQVKGIVDALPDNPEVGDMYVTTEINHEFGSLYSFNGMERISEELKGIDSPWRIPTNEDWMKLATFVSICDENSTEMSGKMLKSKDYWVGNENDDAIKFTVFPNGYYNNTQELIGETSIAKFWSLDENQESNLYCFYDNNDDMGIEDYSEDEMYSIRLVCDYDSNIFEGYVNLFGKKYRVINVEGIKQMWLAENLNYNIGSNDDSITPSYESQPASLNGVVNFWNSRYWEKTPLLTGDIIIDTHNNGYVEYRVKENTNEFIKISQYDANKKKLVYDSGWY